MIELEGVTKTYAGKPVVNEVTFTVGKGDFCVLIGSSGSGKSTTLKMINRLIPLSAGRIAINGEDVTAMRPEALRRRIGYAIQSIGLFPHWTVAQNIGVVPKLLKWPRARIAERVAELLHLFHLDPGEFRDKYPHQLSGGQAQRVGVARALAADPDVLLMDEPFGALDPITRDALQAEMGRVHAETGKTIVFVTHDMDEALKLATRVAIMDRGRLVQYAPPLDILTRPANDFVRDFVGRSDLGLKLLSCETVGLRMRPAPVASRRAPAAELREALARGGPVWLVDDDHRVAALLDTPPADAEAMVAQLQGFPDEAMTSPAATLKEALSRMVWLRMDRLPVVDDEGRLMGELTLESLAAQR